MVQISSLQLHPCFWKTHSALLKESLVVTLLYSFWVLECHSLPNICQRTIEHQLMLSSVWSLFFQELSMHLCKEVCLDMQRFFHQKWWEQLCSDKVYQEQFVTSLESFVSWSYLLPQTQVTTMISLDVSFTLALLQRYWSYVSSCSMQTRKLNMHNFTWRKPQ